MATLNPTQGYAWGQCFVILFLAGYLFVAVCPTTPSSLFADGTLWKGSHRDPKGTLIRGKRSPFIVAFQVTRPPGLFQLSMRKPVIMGVMSNMTSMLLGSELARMLSRGITSSGLILPPQLNLTTSGGASNSTMKIF